MLVKYLDLHAQYLSIKSEIDAAIAAVIQNTSFVLGKSVGEFECDFAGYCGTKYAVGINNGTNACFLALKAAGVGEGDEVITTANTFIATISAIVYTGARPVLVDVDPDTRNIDTNLVEAAITTKTKAIMPVHLYGRMIDLDPMLEMAEHYKLAIVEDSAQAHGAELNGKRAGSVGKVAAFSFYPGKNLGAYGEGGAVTTSDEGIYNNVRSLRDHGSTRKYYHDQLGYNARMEGMQGAVLGVKLKHLDTWNDARREVARKYNERLAGQPVKTPEIPDGRGHVFHCYVIEVDRRDELIPYLAENEIQSIIHYPVPAHRQEAFTTLGYREGDFPVTEKLCRQVVSLPVYPEMPDDHIDHVCDTIKRFISS